MQLGSNHKKVHAHPYAPYFFHLSLIVPTLSGNYHHFFLVFSNHIHSIISDPFHQFCSVTRVGAVLFEESREERAGDMSCKFPRGPLGTPLSTSTYVCAKDPDQLYSSISHHKSTANLSDQIFYERCCHPPSTDPPTPFPQHTQSSLSEWYYI